jgi:hypothetical protein
VKIVCNVGKLKSLKVENNYWRFNAKGRILTDYAVFLSRVFA